MSSIQIESHDSQTHKSVVIQTPKGRVDVHFSYQSVIAFKVGDGPMIVSENCWSTTTGKHINSINNDRKARLPRAVFMQKYEAALDALFGGEKK